MSLTRHTVGPLAAIGLALIGLSFPLDLALLRPALRSEAEAQALARLDVIASAAATHRDLSTLRAVVTKSAVLGAQVLVVDIDSWLVVASSESRYVNRSGDELPLPVREGVLAAHASGLRRSRADVPAGFRQVAAPVHIVALDAGIERGPGVVVLTIDERGARTREFALIAMVSAGKVCVIAALLGSVVFVLHRRVLRPVRDLTTVMDAIRAGELDARADATGSDELGILARHLNDAIEARAEGQLALEESLDRVDAAVSGSSIGLWDWQCGSRRLYVAQHFRAMFGLPPTEPFSSIDEVRSRTHEEDLPMWQDALERHLDHDAPLDVTLRMRGAEGDYRWFRVRASATRDATGRPLRVSGSTTDVTDRRELEEQLWLAKESAEEAAKTKANFLATMSHEIRTPMNGVIGMADVLLDSPLTPEQRDWAEAIKRSGDALLTIINDILDVSKIEAGKMRIEHTRFELDTAVFDVADLLADKARERNVRLITIVAADVPSALVGDPGRLRQIVTNLAGNAVKFTKDGDVSVTVSVYYRDASDIVLRCVVQDSGIGIPGDVLPLLFQPFVQADSSTTRTFGGTGLGLTISKRLAEQMGGSIGVESLEGRGSTFWFTVRLMIPSDLPAAPVAGLGRASVVADHPLVQTAMVQAIKRCGFDAQAIDSSTALTAPSADVVFIDATDPRCVGVAESWPESTRVVAYLNGIRSDVSVPARWHKLSSLRGTQVARATSVASATEPERTTGSQAGRGLGLDVLVAEDNPTNQHVVRLMLTGLECRVTIVENGQQAVAALEQRTFDIVLMDCQMPIMDGLEASATIRRLPGASAAVPIVALTANALDGDRERCLAAGMNDYLPKPIKRDPLRALLEKWTSARPVVEPPAPVPEPQLVAAD